MTRVVSHIGILRIDDALNDAYVAAVVGAKDFSDGEQWPMTMYMVARARLGFFSSIGSWRRLFSQPFNWE